jgi:hypothetical protein
MISIQLIEALLPHARSNNGLLLYAPVDVTSRTPRSSSRTSSI